MQRKQCLQRQGLLGGDGPSGKQTVLTTAQVSILRLERLCRQTGLYTLPAQQKHIRHRIQSTELLQTLTGAGKGTKPSREDDCDPGFCSAINASQQNFRHAGSHTIHPPCPFLYNLCTLVLAKVLEENSPGT
jgi:hypothetical protein